MGAGSLIRDRMTCSFYTCKRGEYNGEKQIDGDYRTYCNGWRVQKSRKA